MKMRKNAVALSVAALIGGLGMAGGASAAVITAVGGTPTTAVDLRVNAGGIGHSLLVPYYTAQRGNSTLINIVNTDTVNGKAVKLRFRGASNSDDVLDFQLFLSPGDVWSANINQRADGLATINTNDNSCTLPSIISGQPFVLNRLPAAITDPAARAAQTREGYVEIFNMADVHPGNALFTAIKHVNGVPPCGTNAAGSAALNQLAVDPTTEAQANSFGLYAPSTGLFSNYGIINQTNGATSWTEPATSIVAVNGLPGRAGENTTGTGNIVFSPQTNQALSTTENVVEVTADPLLRQGAVTALYFDAPDMSTPYTRGSGVAVPRNIAPIRQASNLSMALATTSIRNEFLTTSSISAATDWTLSFPTRRYNIALDYAAAARRTTDFTTAQNSDDDSSGQTRVNYFTLANTSIETSARTNNFPQICVGTGASVNQTTSVLAFYDTSERTPTDNTQFVISPGAGPSPLSFCGEVTVLSFSQDATQPSSVLQAFITRNNVMVPVFPGTTVNDSGWLSISTPGLGGGLPTLGSYFLKATNPANGNFSTNYGGSWSHRYQRPTPAVTP